MRTHTTLFEMVWDMVQSVIVLGAGMVGVSTALKLAECGFSPLLVDRRTPGQETSYGNAGLIQSEAVAPYGFPQGFAALWQVLRKKGIDVNYHVRAIPGLLPALAQYWRHSRGNAYRRITADYSRLIAQALDTHAPWIEACEAEHLVHQTGWLQATRDEKRLQAFAEHAEQLQRDYGVPFAVLDRAALQRVEPGLHAVAGAIHWRGAWSVRDPALLVSHYVDRFVELGGQVALGDAQSLRQQGARWCVQTEDGVVSAAHAVIALGPWSAAITRQLGYALPLFTKRGYHQHFQGQPLRRPTLDADNGFVLAPMRQGLRLTTGAEFAQMQAQATPVQLAKATALAQQLVALGAPIEPKPWVGHRPCTVDMKPIIGPAPKHKGLWFNFGHGHQGFTLGPASAQLLVQHMQGQASAQDVAAFSPQRFA